MTTFAAGRAFHRAARLIAAVLPLAGTAAVARADQSVPVPTIVIYPGDVTPTPPANW